jgi:hypothetical protein
MTTIKALVRLSVVAAVVAIGACTPQATITAHRVEGYAKEPKRIFVIESIGDELGHYHASFRSALTQHLRDCGVDVAFFTRTKPDPLALDNSAAEAQQRKENALQTQFSPDALLLMTQISVTWAGGVPAYPRNIVYALRLFDASTRKEFWAGNVDLFTNFDWVHFGDPGALLANNLIARLVRDRVLQSCPAATH